MPAERLAMRKIREVLRLAAAGHSRRRIARSCSSSHSTVCDYLRRAQEAGLSWPLVTGMDDAELERRLFPPVPPSVASARGVPDWSWVHRELRCPGVTLWLLWQEYKFTHPDGYQYSWFCNHYRAWAAKTEVVMRQTYRAGEVMFVDYAGQTIAIVERDTGAIHQAQIFVAVLGASNYTYAEASWSQTLPDWLAAHVRAFEALGGVPEVVVPDNLKSGVHQPHRYEPELNPSYAELAAPYSVAVIPARVRKPRDKAKVEVGVQVVERWLLARLRHRTFFSLDELNGVLRPLLQALNERPFKKLPGSRHQWFETLERPALAPLPAERYVFAQWKKSAGQYRLPH